MKQNLPSQEKKTLFPTSYFKIWDKNPKSITLEKFDKLVNRLERLGQIKPIMVNSGLHWGEPNIVLGGNSTHKAIAERLKWEKAWYTFVSPIDEKEAIDYAFADNEELGELDQAKAAELMMPYRGTILEEYSFPMGQKVTIRNLLASYGPDDGEAGLPAPVDNYDAAPNLNVEDYNKAYIKQIVIYLVSEEYQKVTDRIQQIMETEDSSTPLFQYYEQVIAKVNKLISAHTLENNTDVFLFLLDFYDRHNG